MTMPLLLPQARPRARRAALRPSCLLALLAGCASTGGPAPQSRPLRPGALAAARSLEGMPPSPAAWPAEEWTALGDAAEQHTADLRLQQVQAPVGLDRALGGGCRPEPPAAARIGTGEADREHS